MAGSDDEPMCVSLHIDRVRELAAEDEGQDREEPSGASGGQLDRPEAQPATTQSLSEILRARPFVAVTYGDTSPQAGQLTPLAIYHFHELIRARRIDLVLDAIEQDARLVTAIEQTTGDAAIHVAAQLRDVELLRLLILAGADVNQRSEAEQVPLLLAVKGYYPRSGGLDTPLSEERKDCDAAAELLLANGAEKAATNVVGEGIMHVAARYRRDNLLIYCAFPPALDLALKPNISGQTPRMIAEEQLRNQKKAQEYLKQEIERIEARRPLPGAYEAEQRWSQERDEVRSRYYEALADAGSYESIIDTLKWLEERARSTQAASDETSEE